MNILIKLVLAIRSLFETGQEPNYPPKPDKPHFNDQAEKKK